MTEFEKNVVARLAALEALSACTLGLLFSMVPNDPRQEKQKAYLELLEKDFAEGMDQYPEAIQREAKAVLSDLLKRVALRAAEDRSPTQQH